MVSLARTWERYIPKTDNYRLLMMFIPLAFFLLDDGSLAEIYKHSNEKTKEYASSNDVSTNSTVSIASNVKHYARMSA